ncbi:hypothetical protein BPAE_0088g00300 [Botrytis paeoniae]|uniref:Uncharacterized protein n=1 Tax=Botrytis paeoniae TaxID=278948 RepID=A0A4Z1FNI8_9HELO|nr:hypothetical protein BPAE_0088g00300 [Botrytis paeoniae]
MGIGTTLPQPVVYGDNPALDDVSTSSAVSLHTIDGNEDSDEQPPSYSYTDESTSTPSADSVPTHPTLGVCSPLDLPSSPIALIAANSELVFQTSPQTQLLYMI